jgi:hypothetical protein
VIALVVASFIAAQCSGAACPSPCTACAFQPVSGTNGSVTELQDLFRTIAQRQGAQDLPSIDNIETGPDRTRTGAEFPCRLLPAIGATESSILQFCEESGLTVISFDCGFGIMQVTSGAAGYPGLEERADINVAAGADILATKWNGNESFGGSFGDSDPSIVESWYFAVWAYNGFVYGNNPNNPNKPANRPPFRSPSSLSRGSYPYQELVWGYLRFPLEKDGMLMWEPLEVSYPTNIPDQSGLFSENLALPEPSHTDACEEVCPPEGCPPPELRTLFLDDADPTFTVTGDVELHADGGFRDAFRSAGLAPVDAPTVVARWEGTAPSTGVFDFGAFVPLAPADCTDVQIAVSSLGTTQTFSLNQNVPGGFFQVLGQVVLAEGRPVVVDVTNGTNDGDVAGHRLGLDAFRFTWREGADVPAEGEGEGEGEGDVGEGEGEGEDGPIFVLPRAPGGCGCSSSARGTSVLDVASLVVVALWARRRRGRT